MEGDAREVGDFAGTTRRDFEARTGQQVVSNEYYMTLTARQRQPSLFDGDDQGH